MSLTSWRTERRNSIFETCVQSKAVRSSQKQSEAIFIFENCVYACTRPACSEKEPVGI